MSDHGFAYIFTIINFLKFNIPIFTSVLVFLSHEIREIIYFCLPFLLFNSVYAVNIILSKTSFLIRCLRKFSCLILILVISFHVVRIFLQTSPLLTYSMPSIFYIRCWMHVSVALGHFFYQWRDYWLFAAMQEIWYDMAKLSLTKYSCLLILWLASGKRFSQLLILYNFASFVTS